MESTETSSAKVAELGAQAVLLGGSIALSSRYVPVSCLVAVPALLRKVSTPSYNNVASMAWKLYAIEQTQL